MALSGRNAWCTHASEVECTPIPDHARARARSDPRRPRQPAARQASPRPDAHRGRDPADRRRFAARARGRRRGPRRTITSASRTRPRRRSSGSSARSRTSARTSRRSSPTRRSLSRPRTDAPAADRKAATDKLKEFIWRPGGVVDRRIARDRRRVSRAATGRRSTSTRCRRASSSRVSRPSRRSDRRPRCCVVEIGPPEGQRQLARSWPRCPCPRSCRRPRPGSRRRAGRCASSTPRAP